MQASSVCSNESHLPSNFHASSSSFSQTRKRTRTRTRTRASLHYSTYLCPFSVLSHALLSEPSAVRDAAVRPRTLRASSHSPPPSQPPKSLLRSLSRSAAPSSSPVDRVALTEEATAIMYSSDLPRARSGMVQFPISAHMVVPEATDSLTFQPTQSRTGLGAK